MQGNTNQADSGLNCICLLILMSLTLTDSLSNSQLSLEMTEAERQMWLKQEGNEYKESNILVNRLRFRSD